MSKTQTLFSTEKFSAHVNDMLQLMSFLLSDCVHRQYLQANKCMGILTVIVKCKFFKTLTE